MENGGNNNLLLTRAALNHILALGLPWHVIKVDARLTGLARCGRVLIEISCSCGALKLVTGTNGSLGNKRSNLARLTACLCVTVLICAAGGAGPARGIVGTGGWHNLLLTGIAFCDEVALAIGGGGGGHTLILVIRAAGEVAADCVCGCSWWVQLVLPLVAHINVLTNGVAGDGAGSAEELLIATLLAVDALIVGVLVAFLQGIRA